MPRFRKNLHVGDEEMNFQFTQLNYPDGIGYFITVADRNKNLYALDLKRSATDEWRIAKKDNLPTWIIDMEQVLANTINEVKAHHLAQSGSTIH